MKKARPNQSAKPKPAPRPSRARIAEAFLRDFDAAWRAHGAEAIARLAEEHPERFCNLAASLLPKQVAVERPLEDFADDELDAAIAELRARLAAAQGPRSGEGAEARAQPAGRVPPLH